MTYIGIVIDKQYGLEERDVNQAAHKVELGRFSISIEDLIDGHIEHRTASFVKHLTNMASWPNQRLANELICKIC